MALVGRRPASLEELPPRKVAPPLRPGTCYGCGHDLRTPLDVALHRCDRYLTMKRRRMGERDARVRL